MARGLGKKVRSETVYPESEVVPLKPVETPPETVGGLLREKRKNFGVDLKEAADYLCIRHSYLQAIEEGRVDDLPGATYAMGFVRAYADYLGLDGPTIVECYKNETTELGDDVRLIFPSPTPEGKIPSGAILLIAVVALAVTYGGWVFFAQQDVKVAELVPSLPESFASFLGSDETKALDAEPKVPQADVATTSVTETATQETVAKVAVPATDTSETSALPNDSVAAATEPPSENTVPVQTTETTETAAAAERPVEAEPAAVSPTSAEAVTSSSSASVENVATAPVQETSTPVTDATAETTSSDEKPVASPLGATDTPEPVASADSAATVATTEPVVQPTVTETAVPVQSNQTASDTLPQSAGSAEDRVAVTEETSRDVVAALPPKPPAVASAEPRQFGSENPEARVMIKARVDSWVEIRDPDGSLLLTRVLRAGDSYRVPDRPGLLMLTGNAGGLEIQVDGEAIPDLGPKGAVRRGVTLDADSLKAGAGRR
ncbi:MAG: DUF4115 domain-containing protein [Alphaproteobacteria bacterium]|nr:DUF4115 domain-containing protein [Alphaproteobacteria bacterium]